MSAGTEEQNWLTRVSGGLPCCMAGSAWRRDEVALIGADELNPVHDAQLRRQPGDVGLGGAWCEVSNLSSERVVVTLTSHALPSVRALTAPVLTTSAPAVAGATLAGRLILPGDGGSLSASRSGMLKVAAVRSDVT